YDLDERLYRLFLDVDLQYSCAVFEHPGMTLDQAQLAKKRLIAAKLLVRPGAHVLDIGCGWGGMALYLARVTGADVTGITLSEGQHRVATERAAAAGLSDRVRFRLQDYREVQGRYDNIVSVGMFEHVGLPQFATYFRTAHRLLAPDGVMLLHAMAQPTAAPYNQPFIDKYIFPGGYIPALSEVFHAVEKSGLLVSDTEILALHYAETTREWRRRFLANRAAVLELYDERFIRMWEFYLAGSESSFRHDAIHVSHLQLVHDQARVPLTRAYIPEEMARLAKAELDFPDYAALHEAAPEPKRRTGS
ncbi:MAG TPA: cyclopropane-fatty-acyl-phospholipid synthase family protein, partial [Amaricoccus sp.]|nr:cyclopropane-fatty-acyl-phospholipid synthase family protein [Amaricoccus sp.]